MRIRKCASRLLGSSYFSSAPAGPATPGFELPLSTTTTPTPTPYPGATESRGGVVCFASGTASAEPCELNRSPWDLIGELDHSDPQEEDIVDKYFVHVACRASWLFPTSSSRPTTAKGPKAEEGLAAGDEVSAKPQHQKVTKKMVKKPPTKKKEVEKEGEESELNKRVKVKKDEVEAKPAAVVVPSGEAQVWTCKKNDGKRWHCQRRVSRPNSLCDYHFEQKRSYYNNPLFESPSETALAPPADCLPAPAPSKPCSKASTSSKARKKKVADAGEGFYYYAGFGPFHTKRQCRSSNMQEPTPVEQEEKEERRQEKDAAPTTKRWSSEDDHQPLAIVVGARDELSRSDSEDIAGIAGGDEESSDDALICNGNGALRAAINSDTKKKCQVRKRWRKPVKARSLKSLM
ncbi:hypothetical protein GUJ93_ZPchr0010g10798 [Zizania palustris]|uniref:WRC domain-containing protein n=1 Tax=Zizania palustris TaxID=103762 RepID=A0A8J5WGR2_ZIZPA|nr:hypothetical protein GUJ93_ZPchr0010g10798 [Zizania palustris]